MISFVGSAYQFKNMTTCALRSMLPVYVAMCDAKAIECEESLLSLTPAEVHACDQTIGGNAPCSSECAAFVTKLSSGSKCAESAFSIQEVVAHAAQKTCADSGKLSSNRCDVVVATFCVHCLCLCM
jgi:hypothetical protein